MIASPRDRELFGHPFGLTVLFFTELWERFSYYGMRALLIFYMTKHLFLAGNAEHVVGYAGVKAGLEAAFGPLSVQAMSSQIYGLYTALVYLTPVFGGLLADRVLGQRRAVFIGGVVIALGHFVLAMESLFFPALLLIIVGTGLLKPNVSTQVGLLYKKGDPRRDRAFNAYYVGVNVGAFLAPIVCGTLGELWGWHYGFGAAGIGMLLGLAVYAWGKPYLAPDVLTQREESGARAKQPFTKREWLAIAALLFLCALNAPWWAVYEQQGNTLALWADNNTNRRIFAAMGSDWEMPASWFQSFNSFFIFAFTPLLGVLWAWQSKRGKEPTSAMKMAIACFTMAASFSIMIGAARDVQGGGLASLWWLTACTAIATVSELYISPVGLSLVTKVAPKRVVSLMMGLWFLANMGGNYLAGYLGSFWEKMPKERYFMMLAGIAFFAGVAMLVVMGPMKRAIGDENAPEPS